MANGADLRQFLLAIRASQREGGFECEVASLNDGVPREVVILQLRALLRRHEREYFDSFEHHLK